MLNIILSNINDSFTDRLPVRYELLIYSPIERELNDLIQKSVEHGFVNFYDRLEVFFRQLTDKSSNGEPQFQSEEISMENIWIYVKVCFVMHCFNCMVFMCELLIFHRKKIFRALLRLYHGCRKVIASWWTELVSTARAIKRATTNVKCRERMRAIRNQKIQRN